MKKVSMLSQAEMKNVMGGLPPAGDVICTITDNQDITHTYRCTGTVTQCQEVADLNCENSSSCQDVDCR